MGTAPRPLVVAARHSKQGWRLLFLAGLTGGGVGDGYMGLTESLPHLQQLILRLAQRKRICHASLVITSECRALPLISHGYPPGSRVRRAHACPPGT